MAGFDFVLVLLSFVYALALAVVLQSAGRLVIERHRVKFSGLMALAMLNAVVTVFISWLGMWLYRDTKGITLYDVTLFFVSSLLIYLFCVAVSPEPDEAGEVNMGAFFGAQTSFIYGVYALLILSYAAANAIYLRTSHPELFVQQTLGDVPPFAVAVAGFVWRNERVQWAVGILILIISVAWAIAFNGSF
jgi:hypothetical protein